MTEQSFPITPPPELVKQWAPEIHQAGFRIAPELFLDGYTQAARWGWEQRGAVNEAELQKARDEELEACCDVLARWGVHGIDKLRAARRPKPPSLADEALEALDRMDQFPTLEDQNIVHAALERLKELEASESHP